MDKIKVAITGGIGSGKSTVLRIIKELGYPCFSCDEIYKDVLTTEEYVEKIEKVFPTCVIDGKIQKEILANLIFQEKEKRDLLNKIAHPLIMENLYYQMETCENRLVFAEIPLLFEGDLEDKFDKIIVVIREKTARIQSIKNRDNISEEKIMDRMRAQFDYFSKEGQQRIKNCNAILLENCTIEQLRMDLQNIIKNL